MAVVTQPLGSAEARGSVGGLTYNTWRGRHTVKSRSGPSREPTADQLAVLALGKNASLHWSEIDQEQRDGWRRWANEHPESDWTGQPKRLSGHSWYVRLYVRASLVGETPIDDPPNGIPDWLPQTLYASQSGANWYINWDPFSIPPVDQEYIEVYLTAPLSAGRNPTLHDADRTGYADAMDTAFNLGELLAGWYTCWIRPVRFDGMVGSFQSIRFEVS